MQPPELRPSRLHTAEALTALRADKEHSDWANFISFAHHGTQASLDFFRLPPAGMARFATGSGAEGLIVDGILRVHTTTGELCTLLAVVRDYCSPCARFLGAATRTRECLTGEVDMTDPIFDVEVFFEPVVEFASLLPSEEQQPYETEDRSVFAWATNIGAAGSCSPHPSL